MVLWPAGQIAPLTVPQPCAWSWASQSYFDDKQHDVCLHRAFHLTFLHRERFSLTTRIHRLQQFGVILNLLCSHALANDISSSISNTMCLLDEKNVLIAGCWFLFWCNVGWILWWYIWAGIEWCDFWNCCFHLWPTKTARLIFYMGCILLNFVSWL